MTYCEMYARDLLRQTKLCVGVDIDIEERDQEAHGFWADARLEIQIQFRPAYLDCLEIVFGTAIYLNPR